jgi:NAD(P)-dependent dehydrogenase (short-subunit alcohol dehydrogenase family)
MTTVLLINPNTSVGVTGLMSSLVAPLLDAPLELVAVTARFGASYISSEASYAIAAHALLDAWAAHRAAGGRCDAVLVGCFGDPGVAALREIAGVPVIGLAEASLREAAAQVLARAGRCDILVNSAGFTKAVPAADLEALDDDLFDAIVQSNLRGMFASVRAFAPLLKASGDGLIVNVSSIAGFTGAGSNLAYVAAKAGVDVLTKSLGKALAPQVRVLSVSPGVVDSSFVPGRGADFNAKTAATMPLQRVGLVEDVASAIEACATTMRFATGTRFVVDGGRSL